MNPIRRYVLSGLLAGLSLLAGCAVFDGKVDPQVRQTLAPSGKLRVGVYPGSPTSMVPVPGSSEKVGVALDLGRELARRLEVPLEVVEFRRIAEVLDAVKAGAVDFTFTNATAVRARDMDFTAPLLNLELGYLVPRDGSLTSLADVDQPGRRIGVSQGSTSQRTLTAQYKQATVVPVASLGLAAEMLAENRLDAFATNKAILYELSDKLPGSRMLDGRWGLEQLAIAIPKGRESGMNFVRKFATYASDSGLLQSAVLRAGLRGTVKAD